MTMTLLLRRSGAVLTSVGVAAALTLLSPVSANAAVHAQFGAQGSADADYTGPTVDGECTLTSPAGSDDVSTTPTLFTHGTKHRSLDLDATFASPDNASDTVRIRGHVSTAVTVKRHHHDLTAFDLSAGGSVKITHAMSNSSCRGSGDVLGVTEVVFTEHHKGWFTLTRDTKKPNSISAFAMLDAKNGHPVTVDVFEGPKSHQTSRALLKPGTYVIEIAEVGVTAGTTGLSLKTQPRETKVAQTIHIHGEFKPKKK